MNVLLLALTAGLSAATAGLAGGSTAARAATVAATIENSGNNGCVLSSGGQGSLYCFIAENTAASKGDTVSWTSNSPSPVAHTVTRCTASACSGVGAGSGDATDTFGTALPLTQGQSFSHVFASGGVYNYYCTIHGYAGMHGVVTVAAAPVFTAVSPPSPTARGSAYSYTFAASGTPVPTFAVASGSLPGGLALDPATGILAGTSTTAGAFVFTVSASNGAGTVTSGSLSITVLAPAAGSYQGAQPGRVCDTRAPGPQVVSNQCDNGGVAGSGPLGAGLARDIQVCAGFGGPDACTLGAVTMNVAVTSPSSASFLTAYPTGSVRPTAANLTYVPGDTKSVLVQVKVGSAGNVTFYNAYGTVDLIVDREGTMPSAGAFSAGSPGLFHPLQPARVCDTRAAQPGITANPCDVSGSSPVGPGATRNVQITGQGGVPATTVSAVVLDLAAADTTAASYLTAWPAGNVQPLAANLDWTAGQVVSNRVVVPIGANGQISLFNAYGSLDVILDVNGWFGDGTEAGTTGAVFMGVNPVRICDSRGDQPGQIVTNQCNAGGAGDALQDGQTKSVQVSGGALPVPAGAHGVVASVTATDTAAASFLTVWPGDQGQPTAADVIWGPGQTVSNLVVVKLSPSGQISLFNAHGTADVVIDVVGYYP